MDKRFWKVSYNNFNSFILFLIENDSDYNLKRLKRLRKNYIDNYINNTDILYICIEEKSRYTTDKYYVGYCKNNLNSYNWLLNKGYKYMGEYNGRKKKLEILNSICGG